MSTPRPSRTENVLAAPLKPLKYITLDMISWVKYGLIFSIVFKKTLMQKPNATEDNFVPAKFVPYEPSMDISVLTGCLLSDTWKAAAIFASSDKYCPPLKPFTRS